MLLDLCHTRSSWHPVWQHSGLLGPERRTERAAEEDAGQGQGEVPAGGQGDRDQDGRAGNQVRDESSS